MVELKGKAEEIYLLLSEPDVDLWKLRELALTEGGLVNGMKIHGTKDLRRKDSHALLLLSLPVRST